MCAKFHMSIFKNAKVRAIRFHIHTQLWSCYRSKSYLPDCVHSKRNIYVEGRRLRHNIFIGISSKVSNKFVPQRDIVLHSYDLAIGQSSMGHNCLALFDLKEKCVLHAYTLLIHAKFHRYLQNSKRSSYNKISSILQLHM